MDQALPFLGSPGTSGHAEVRGVNELTSHRFHPSPDVARDRPQPTACRVHLHLTTAKLGDTVPMTPYRSSIARLLALSIATLAVACGASQSPGSSSGAENKTSGVDVSGFQAPDASMTPGKGLTRNISVISAPGYTASVRNVPDSEKKAVAAAYN